jgi:hypothetical protein
MCLEVKFSQDVPKRTFAYKVVAVVDGKKYPPYREGSYTYKYGQWFKSDRKNNELSLAESASGNIYNGIHVYKNKRAAERSVAFKCYLDRLIIKVAVRPNDWVADGYHGDAVYMKVKPIGPAELVEQTRAV